MQASLPSKVVFDVATTALPYILSSLAMGIMAPYNHPLLTNNGAGGWPFALCYRHEHRANPHCPRHRNLGHPAFVRCIGSIVSIPRLTNTLCNVRGRPCSSFPQSTQSMGRSLCRRRRYWDFYPLSLHFREGVQLSRDHLLPALRKQLRLPVLVGVVYDPPILSTKFGPPPQHQLIPFRHPAVWDIIRCLDEWNLAHFQWFGWGCRRAPSRPKDSKASRCLLQYTCVHNAVFYAQVPNDGSLPDII